MRFLNSLVAIIMGAMSREHTCINHPSRPASARCQQCNSPICDECVDAFPLGNFCSRIHADRYAAFGARRHTPRRSIKGLVFWFIALLLTVLIVGALLAHMAGYIRLPITVIDAPMPEEQSLVAP